MIRIFWSILPLCDWPRHAVLECTSEWFNLGCSNGEYSCLCKHHNANFTDEIYWGFLASSQYMHFITNQILSAEDKPHGCAFVILVNFMQIHNNSIMQTIDFGRPTQESVDLNLWSLSINTRHILQCHKKTLPKVNTWTMYTFDQMISWAQGPLPWVPECDTAQQHQWWVPTWCSRKRDTTPCHYIENYDTE